MDALDPNYVPFSLIKLQKLNIKAVYMRREIFSLKSKLSSTDGYRKDLRLKEGPGKTGPPQESNVVNSNLKKQDIVDKLKKITHELKLIEAEIEKVIDSLEFRLRQKEWELLRDVYMCCFSNDGLNDLYGPKWRKKLKQIFIEYGGDEKF